MLIWTFLVWIFIMTREASFFPNIIPLPNSYKNLPRQCISNPKHGTKSQWPKVPLPRGDLAMSLLHGQGKHVHSRHKSHQEMSRLNFPIQQEKSMSSQLH